MAALVLSVAAAVLVSALWFAGGVDEVAAIRSELREAGYVVQDVAPLAARTFPGNGGELVAVPEGARLYRVTYRPAPGTRYKEAYRVVAGPFGDRWSFPEAQ